MWDIFYNFTYLLWYSWSKWFLASRQVKREVILKWAMMRLQGPMCKSRFVGRPIDTVFLTSNCSVHRVFFADLFIYLFIKIQISLWFVLQFYWMSYLRRKDWACRPQIGGSLYIVQNEVRKRTICLLCTSASSNAIAIAEDRFLH